MTVYAVERTQQFIENHLQKYLSPLIHNIDLYERAADWMDDRDSRARYQKELAYMILWSVLKDEKLVADRLSGLSPDEWQRALETAADLLHRGEVPLLEYPPDSPAWLGRALIASIFVRQQYAYGSTVTVEPGDVVIDGGGCCGESAIWARMRGAARVFSFEPSTGTFEYLCRNVQKYFADGTVIPQRMGLDEDTVFRGLVPGEFVTKTRLTLDENSPMKVPAVTLDEWCAQHDIVPTFIKLNLEGAEGRALTGAKEIISKHRPRLAVAIYHSLADMGVIPALIKSFCPDYRFWCKKSSVHSGFILFARA